jgi:serine/threonine protein kinase/Tfp pilus assembly protein PilF
MYVVERKIASGGMATVFRGYDPALDRPVAIKVLRPELATAVGAERFLREARHLAQVSHPNVIAVHEVGETDGLYFYVMDFVDASTLGQLLQEGPLSMSESLRVTTDLLKALEAVHAAGLVHRDIKPSNIFVPDDRAILGDFGIAKAVELKGAEPLTSDGQMIGTPGYMAPEQRYGEEVTPRTDLYAVGLVLFKCMTGRDWTLSEPIEITLSDVPAEFRRVVSRAVAIDPADRWSDAQAFRSALIEAAPPGTHPEGPAPASALAGRRAITIVLFAAISLVGIIIGRCPAPVDVSDPSLVVLPCDNNSPDPNLDYYAEELAVELNIALGNVPGLSVVGRWTAKNVPDSLDAGEIGDLLDVNFLVTCEARRGGDSLRMSAQLESTETRRQLWSDAYMATDVNTVVEGVTREIVEKLLPVDASLGPLVRGQSTNLEAVDLYLLGRNAWSRRTEAALEEAERSFRQALEIDPDYALAYGGLADIYVVLTARGFRDMAPDSAFPIARQYAQRSIDLAPTLAEPHAALAEAQRAYFWEDWADAGEHYRRAIDLNPNYPDAHTWYSLYLSAMGRHDEAIAEAQWAADLELLSPRMATGLARAHFDKGDFPAAFREIDRALRLDPGFAEAGLWLSATLIKLGDNDRALELLDLAAARTDLPPLYLATLAYGFAAAGEPERAEQLLDALEASDPEYVSPFWIAVTLGELGRLDEAFEKLREAFELRDEFMVRLAVSPFADALHEDPRFTEWVDRMADFIGPQPETEP